MMDDNDKDDDNNNSRETISLVDDFNNNNNNNNDRSSTSTTETISSLWISSSQSPAAPSFSQLPPTHHQQQSNNNNYDDTTDTDTDIPTLLCNIVQQILQRIQKPFPTVLQIRRCLNRLYYTIYHFNYNNHNNLTLSSFNYDNVKYYRSAIRTFILRYSDSRQAPTKQTFCLLVCILLVLSTLNHTHKSNTPPSNENNHHHTKNNGMANYQSYGLFHEDNINSDAWKMMKHRVHTTKPHKYADVNAWIDEPNVWYHNNWNADFTCPFEERVGGIGVSSSSSDGGSDVDSIGEGLGSMKQTQDQGGNGNGGGGWLGDGPKWVCNPRSIVQMVRRRMKGADTSTSGAIKSFVHRVIPKSRTTTNGKSTPPLTPTTPPTNGCLIYSIGVNGQSLEFEHSVQRLLTQEAAVLDYETYGGYDIRGKQDGSNSDSGSDSSANKGTSNGGAGTPFCEIHVFDPDGWHEKIFVGDGIHYHDWGIVHQYTTDYSNSDSPGQHGRSHTTEDSPKFKTFQDTVKELGHVGHALDIMKVDCKLCEWDIFQDWFDHGGGGDGGTGADDNKDGGGNEQHDSGEVDEVKGLHIIHQLLVEVHGTPEPSVNAFFDKMRDEHYVIFHKEPNTQTFGGTCQDYAFLKLRPDFFKL